MSSDQLASIQEKGIQLMTEGFTCAEATLQVLLEEIGLGDISCQWAAAGYMGAITSGKTICGCLFGGTVFLGLVQVLKTDQLPLPDSDIRAQAVSNVEQLYRGFIEQFGDTDCYKLTGCDWGNRRDVVRYFREEVYIETCYRFMQYVLSRCINLADMVMDSDEIGGM